LSCGGNDITGDRLSVLLRHAKSPNPGLDLTVVDALFARLEETIAALVAMLKSLGQTFFNRDIPVVIHGYGYAVADGRGFLSTSFFSGPWLAPSLKEKGYDSLADRISIIQTLIDRFNDMQRRIATNIPNIAHVDARLVLSDMLVKRRLSGLVGQRASSDARWVQSRRGSLQRGAASIPGPVVDLEGTSFRLSVALSVRPQSANKRDGELRKT
jgi:hypothetical protein